MIIVIGILILAGTSFLYRQNKDIRLNLALWTVFFTNAALATFHSFHQNGNSEITWLWAIISASYIPVFLFNWKYGVFSKLPPPHKISAAILIVSILLTPFLPSPILAWTTPLVTLLCTLILVDSILRGISTENKKVWMFYLFANTMGFFFIDGSLPAKIPLALGITQSLAVILYPKPDYLS